MPSAVFYTKFFKIIVIIITITQSLKIFLNYNNELKMYSIQNNENETVNNMTIMIYFFNYFKNNVFFNNVNKDNVTTQMPLSTVTVIIYTNL